MAYHEVEHILSIEDEGWKHQFATRLSQRDAVFGKQDRVWRTKIAKEVDFDPGVLVYFQRKDNPYRKELLNDLALKKHYGECGLSSS